jgi:hypothetical protein
MALVWVQISNSINVNLIQLYSGLIARQVIFVSKDKFKIKFLNID